MSFSRARLVTVSSSSFPSLPSSTSSLLTWSLALIPFPGLSDSTPLGDASLVGLDENTSAGLLKSRGGIPELLRFFDLTISGGRDLVGDLSGLNRNPEGDCLIGLRPSAFRGDVMPGALENAEALRVEFGEEEDVVASAMHSITSQV